MHRMVYVLVAVSLAGCKASSPEVFQFPDFHRVVYWRGTFTLYVDRQGRLMCVGCRSRGGPPDAPATDASPQVVVENGANLYPEASMDHVLLLRERGTPSCPSGTWSVLDMTTLMLRQVPLATCARIVAQEVVARAGRITVFLTTIHRRRIAIRVPGPAEL